MENSISSNHNQELDGHKPPVLDSEQPPLLTQPSPRSTPPRHNIRKLILIILLGIGAIAGVIYAIHWLQYTQTHQETDDAYVTSDINPVNARISGTVSEVLVRDNQEVKKGTILVKLDPNDEQLSLQQAKAALVVNQEQANVALANIKVAQANVTVTATNAQGATTQAQGNINAAVASVSTSKEALAEASAGVPVAQANLAQVKANLLKAKLDYKRFASLYNSGATPKQQLDTAKADYDALVAQEKAASEQVTQARARVAQAKQNLTNAQAKLAATKGTLQQANANTQQTKVNEGQYKSSQQQYKSAVAAIAQAQTQIKNAQLQLSYTSISAPTDGQVGNKTVEVGQRVQPGQTLMYVVQEVPWIVANFKETQLRKMHPGQEVEIKIDAFGGHAFKGKVDSVSPASGAKFSLLPPDNATGNFTKIVQRLPVKIVFDPQSIRGYESRIAPGMSVVVTVVTQ